MILVVGATGLLGKEICRRLRRQDRVRGLVRPGSPVEHELAALGVEIVHGDLKDASSIEVACRGVGVVVTTATCIASRRRGDTLRKVDRDGQLDLVRIADAEGARRFIYVSLSPNLSENCILVHYKREVERAVRKSGMDWTVLHPGAFMEIWFGPQVGWDLSKGKARVIGRGAVLNSYVSVRDVAAFAVAATHDPAMIGRNIPVGVAEPVSQNQAVAIFEEAAGRPFRVQRIPIAPFRAASRLLRPFSERMHSLMELGIAVAEGDRLEMAPICAEFPIPLTSVEEYALGQVCSRNL